MPRSINVRLNEAEQDALVRFALREDRDPRVQAQRFIREGLIREGALTKAPPPEDDDA